MKVSSSYILCLVALVASTIVSSSGQVSARNNGGSFVGTKILKKSKSSPKSESSSILPPSPSSMEESLLTLYGLDRSVPLTKDEAAFLEEVIQDAYNEVEDDYFAKSVLIEDGVVDYNDEGGNNRSLLRGSSINNSNRKLISDQEMCHDENLEVIPGCTFEIDFYIDPYCNYCAFDDEPNMTREPSSVPSRPPTLPPTRDPCNDPNNYRFGLACDDDDDDSYNSGYKNNYKNQVSSSSSSDEDEEQEQLPPQPPLIYYPPPPTGTRPVDEIIPVVPPIISPPIRPTMAEIILKKLNKSRFNRFKFVKKVRLSSSNNGSSRFGGKN